MKRRCFLALFLLIAPSLFSQQALLSVKLNGVLEGKGVLYAAVYDSKEGYKKEKPFKLLELEPVSSVVEFKLEVPNGHYVIAVFQDLNENIKLDTKIFGIPAEPVGITNYQGRGIPGGFNRLKIEVNGSQCVEIAMIVFHF